MNANGDFSIWLEDMPGEEFHYKAGNDLKAPIAQVGLSIRLIAPAVDKHISYKANGSLVTIIVQQRIFNESSLDEIAMMEKFQRKA